MSHDSGTVVGENPLKKLKDARERDHPKGIDASESHGGLCFFAKSSCSELELWDSSLCVMMGVLGSSSQNAGLCR